MGGMVWRRHKSIKRSSSIPVIDLSYSSCSQCRFLHYTCALYKKRKTKEEKKAAREVVPLKPKPKLEVIDVWRNMTVRDLAEAMKKDVDFVFEVMLYVPNSDDYDSPKSVIDDINVIKEVVKKAGMKCRISAPPGREVVKEEKNRDVTRRPPPDPSELVKRPPVVTIMGHVDHGKTTLLDALRHTSVVETEFGGITQHIGAFTVTLSSGNTITFLDTPGHAAFTAMRARGAQVTDIVVLVVAADDGVMEQTVESIKMAKDANVPILVAINKIDKPNADIQRTKEMLVPHGIQVEDYGGDIQAVPISALKGTNLDQLQEAIVLQAELMNLKGDPKGMVEGVVIESKLDVHRGKLSTALVQRGTLRKGAILVSGMAWAKVRAMFNEQGRNVDKAPPSTPVEVIGWRELPSAGDEIIEVESEKRAHEVIKWRESQELLRKAEEERKAVSKKIEEHQKVYKAELQKKREMGIRYKMRSTTARTKEIIEDTSPKLAIVVKGDVDGSVEAILDMLETYDSNSECRLDLVHYGVGNVTESDVDLAEAFKGKIYVFNVGIPPAVKDLAESKNVQIREHRVIYKLFDDLKKDISEQLPTKPVDEILGEAEVLQEFLVTEGKKKVPVAGCTCTLGVLKKSARYKVLRKGEVIHEGTMASMRHLKSEVESIKKGTECGLRLSDVTVTFEPGDVIQCYEVKQVKQELEWEPWLLKDANVFIK